MTIALRELLEALGRFVANNPRQARPPRPQPLAEPSPKIDYQPLRRLVLADEVSRNLFAEYAGHRRSDRGSEETGWVLLGLRTVDEAIALATLPAGTERDAGGAHIQFDWAVQAFASRVVRQQHRQLGILGVVHSHPGSMRHPSDGDFRGDIDWVANLRGREGVFGIGTADAPRKNPSSVGWQPAPHVQCLDELCLSWYSLREGDRNYRRLAVELTIGPDLALPLRSVWSELENHAKRLDRLARCLANSRFDIIQGREKSALALNIPLTGPDQTIRVVMEGKEVRYLLLGPDGDMIADFRDDRVDHGVFVMLAELTS